MKRIEIDTSLPSKSEWEFAIVPNINFGYVSNYSDESFFIGLGWLLWYVIIIIKNKK